jgi:hypothetical protein
MATMDESLVLEQQRSKHLCMATGDGQDAKWTLVWIVAFILFTGASAVLGWAVNGPVIGFWAPLFSHGVQWLVCTFHAFPFQTERYYDLMGAITYISLTLFTLLFTVSTTLTVHPRQVLASSLVVVWALRLGSFLFGRIKRDGKDKRFDNLKPYYVAFLGTWNIQGTWCYLTGLSVWSANSRAVQPAIGWLDGVGLAVWVLGFGVECLADHQKTIWRKLPTSKGRYIDVGLWRYSVGANAMPKHAVPAALLSRLAPLSCHVRALVVPAAPPQLLWRIHPLARAIPPVRKRVHRAGWTGCICWRWLAVLPKPSVRPVPAELRERRPDPRKVL